MTLPEFYNKVNPAVGVAQIVFNHLFKEFPVKKIKDVADTTSGGTPDRGNPEYWYGGKIPWIKSGETNDGLITTFEETITEKALANSSAKLFPKGTLLVAMYGATAGKTGILDFESTTNQALCAVFPNKKVIDRDFLFWFFRQRRFGYLQESFGGAQPNISQTVIKDTDIPIPDLDTQREVVSFLEKCEVNGELDASFKFNNIFVEIRRFFSYRNAYDNLLLSQATQLSLLTALRQAILTEAVQGKLTAQWRRDNPNQEPAGELLKRIAAEKARLIKEKKISKEKPLPPIKAEEMPYEVPEGWVWCRADEVVSFNGGVAKGKELKGNLVQTPYLRVANVQRGHLDLRMVKEIVVSDSDYKKYQLQVGDLLMIEGGDPDKVGRCAIWRNEIPNCIHQNHIFRVRAYRVKELSIEFLETFFNSPVCQAYYEKSAKQTTNLASINKSQMRMTPIIIPPLPEQHAIVQKVNTLLAYCDELEQQVQQSKADLDLLMQAVLGEVFGTERQA